MINKGGEGAKEKKKFKYLSISHVAEKGELSLPVKNKMQKNIIIDFSRFFSCSKLGEKIIIAKLFKYS